MPDDSPPPRSPFADHPTARAVLARAPAPRAAPMTVAELRELALSLGAEDASAVSLAHPDLEGERPYVAAALRGARTLVSIVMRMHPDDVRSPQRSVANLEFHRAGHGVDDVAHAIARALSDRGHRAINPAMAFPMEMDAFPERGWIVSHKRVAVAAGLGHMGIHRSVIHPRFGSFILLGTVITDAELSDAPEPLAFDPCLGCKLCVAACPVGALEQDGTFRFSACYTHNYREFMSGFTDFVEEVVESRDRADFRARVSQGESTSMWQSLAYQPNYKAAYCLAVCPAGEDVIGPFLHKRADHLRDVVKPLLDRTEPLYVIAGSDAEAHAKKRFPHKRLRVVRSGLRAKSAKHFVASLPLSFQRGPARGWKGTFHFDLGGDEGAQATVRIDDGSIDVAPGLVGDPDTLVRCDGALWIAILEGQKSAIWAVLTGRLKIRGNRSLMPRFAKCFPR